MDELNTEMYKNFEIGKANLFGATVYTVRPTNYAHDAYNFHHGGTDDLGDPEENIYCGAQILAYYVERCGAEACALSAYNVGPYSDKRQDAGQRYVAKVARWRDRLAEVGGSSGSRLSAGSRVDESIAL